ncbi:hypothetical protein XA68_14141 [Ophiocordyceps unilateralis]|uniref:AB hydrolase-1 domain-containing protein n=1 Tax=Ophiocordyceps unilateralis TaxID=268505 RepID=A0A2A9PBC1_OPHUN|nr:hypothetical protein XA68_14141 [Ophiocordyceps unilateralis]
MQMSTNKNNSNGPETATPPSDDDDANISLPQLEAHLAPVGQPVEGAFSTRTVLFVRAYWAAEDGEQERAGGHMYVERLDPLLTVQPLPIILIHGDWHTGQVWNTKPDGKPGWASYFNYQGYRVYVVDLPACGRSNSLTAGQLLVANQSAVPSEAIVARDVTATASQTQEGWDTARLHTQWPGSGQSGDAIFDRYYASLVPLLLRKADRQKLAQSALSSLLDETGPAILIGEGSGATMAWLAADAKPQQVAAVMAIEPAGPPCGTARSQQQQQQQQPDISCHHHHRRFSPQIRLDRQVRAWGLADIPMQFDPPVKAPADLDVIATLALGHQGTCAMQACAENSWPRQAPGPPPTPRRLTNLETMPHLVVTAQASSHSTYDWATVKFLRQAGAKTDSKRLEEYGVLGNGHLMFLEENSDEIACLLCMWIAERFPTVVADV